MIEPISHLNQQVREFEQALIGALLLDPDSIINIATKLKPDDFGSFQYAGIFKLLCQMVRNQQDIDLMLVAHEATNAGVNIELDDLITLVSGDISTLHIESYAAKIAEFSKRRKAYVTAKNLLNAAQDESSNINQSISKAIDQSLDIQAENTTGLTPIDEIATDYLEWLERDPNEPIGLKSGWLDVDKILLGFQNRQVYLLAGRPGMGKSTAALNLAANWAFKQGKRVAIFTMEMSARQVFNRMIASKTNISLGKIIKLNLTESERQQINETAARMATANLEIDDTAGLTISEIHSKCRAMQIKRGLDAVIIDYVGLVKAEKEIGNRTMEMGQISRAMVAMAADLNVPVLALSQLNRSVEKQQDKRPSMADLRDSGDLEQDAFCIMLMYRDEYYNPEMTEHPNIVEINIAKHRDGATGTVDLYWKGETVTIRNLQRQPLDADW